MDLLTGNVRKLYFKFLSAAFGSALISSIYGMVDMAMVGQYQGPDGAAALAVVAPVWNIIYSLGLLTGIGGSVLFSARRGGGQAARTPGAICACDRAGGGAPAGAERILPAAGAGRRHVRGAHYDRRGGVPGNPDRES